MEASVDTIKTLRDQTGAGIMDCKRAIEEADGDLSKAEEILKEKGISAAAKKKGRTTNDGVIESYIHSGGRIGALVEVNCETDFVARTDDFRQLAHDLAMQVAAMTPLYVDSDDVPEGEDTTPPESLLMQQPFIKDPSKSIKEMVEETVGKLGENIKVRRFARFALGE